MGRWEDVLARHAHHLHRNVKIEHRLPYRN